MTKEEYKSTVKSILEKNKRERIKQEAMVEMVCHLRTRIDEAERRIAANDKELRKFKKEYYQTKYSYRPITKKDKEAAKSHKDGTDDKKPQTEPSQ